MNVFKTSLLMIGLTLLLVWVGGLVGGKGGMMLAFAMAGVMNFVSYWFSDKIVLMMYRAKEVKENEMPELHEMTRRLTGVAGIPMPKLYFIDSPMPNAFATGRDPRHAAVAVTRGITDLLDDRELSGVIAHELSHVKNRDVLIGTVAATIAGAIFMLARMAQFAAIFGGGSRDRGSNGGNPAAMMAVALIAPLAAMVIQMAISRSREYHADTTGARLSGDPLSLARALQKLAGGVRRNPMEVNPATAHMFIVSPFNGRSLFTLFSTHPPIEARV
ncbi:MAG: zinc metalloprotease HtpX, partial [Endomicrobiales bacterium]